MLVVDFNAIVFRINPRIMYGVGLHPRRLPTLVLLEAKGGGLSVAWVSSFITEDSAVLPAAYQDVLAPDEYYPPVFF